jgi:hypothetical protein
MNTELKIKTTKKLGGMKMKALDFGRAGGARRHPAAKNRAARLVPRLLALAFAPLFFHALSAPLLAQVTAAEVSNPAPDKHDYSVPLPCGLSMAFRLILIPEQGALGEVSSHFGTELQHQAGGGGGENFESRRHKVYLGSALSADELPKSFQPKAAEILKAAGGGGAKSQPRQLYLMGKYEVSRAQYQAVMEGCAAIPENPALPVTGISWYDAMDFTDALMAWLIKEHPDSLPVDPADPKSVGIVRLPTEEEWEYAARGGHMVSVDVLSSEDFFPMPEGKTIEDYALFADGARQPQAPGPIGSHLPNPAGLYDTAGNASEYLFEPFRMTLGARLHGSAGGPVLKGGSFLSGKSGVAPGAREEAAFIGANGAYAPPGAGFRVALSQVNLGSRQKEDRVFAEYNEATRTDTTLSRSDDPLKIVSDLLGAAENPNDRRTFEILRTAIMDYNFSINEQRRLSARSYAWSLVYSVFGIRINGARLKSAEASLKPIETEVARVERLIKNKDTPAKNRQNMESKLPELIKLRTTWRGTVKDYNTSYDKQRDYYATLLKLGAGYPRDLLLSQLDLVGQDIKGDDRFSRELRHCYATASKHLDLVLNKKGDPAKIKRAELEDYPAKL